MVALGVSSPAAARVTCSFSAASHRLIVRSTSGGDEPQLERQGDEIVVEKFLGPRETCQGGTPTMFNTDSIKVSVSGFVPGADILLDGGPLAPGATPEKTGASEIEVHVTGKNAMADVIGTPGPDEFRWARFGNSAGLNVNPGRRNDRDVDVSVGGLYAFLVGDGGRGRDRILPATPFERLPGGAYSAGGAGRDVLVASRSGAILDGGGGKDLIRGGPSFDLINGGGGRDRITGGGGPDEIGGGGGRDVLLAGPGDDSVNSKDARRDRVECAGGHDSVRADRFDHLSSCERVRGQGGRVRRGDFASRLQARHEVRLRRSLHLAHLRR